MRRLLLGINPCPNRLCSIFFFLPQHDSGCFEWCGAPLPALFFSPVTLPISQPVPFILTSSLIAVDLQDKEISILWLDAWIAVLMSRLYAPNTLKFYET